MNQSLQLLAVMLSSARAQLPAHSFTCKSDAQTFQRRKDEEQEETLVIIVLASTFLYSGITSFRLHYEYSIRSLVVHECDSCGEESLCSRTSFMMLFSRSTVDRLFS
jgi:hypothetical protein